MNLERKELILKLRKEGFTIPQICKELKISKGTVGYYLKDFPQKRKKIFNQKEYQNSKYVSKSKDEFQILDVINLSKEDFIKKSIKSNSIKGLAIELKISATSIKKLQNKLNCHPKNLKFQGRGVKRDFTNILNGSEVVENTQNKSITGTLKKFILKNNLKEHKCEECGLDTWNKKPLSLELDHTDGIRSNNRIENLKLLCPNCHSQTPTWRGRNKIKK
jgi:Zn finger protein HypA/HybF involved in hydrogenase expression/predicted transcriptional regulator